MNHLFRLTVGVALLALLAAGAAATRPDWLEEMVRFCLLPGVGCVGTRLLYPDGTIQHAGVVLGMHRFFGLLYHKAPAGHRDEFGSPEMYRDLLGVIGACQMLPRRVFEAVGGFEAIDAGFNNIQ